MAINPLTGREEAKPLTVTATVPTNAAGYGEGASSVDLTPINEYIGAALQELYGWTNNSIFYSISDATMRPFYRLVQNWERWQSGFVYPFHNVSNGCVPTRFAKVIVDKVASLIYGGGVMFSKVGVSTDEEGNNKTLDYIGGEWAKNSRFKEVLQDGIHLACGLGTSALKLNVSAGEPWTEAVPFNRFFANLDPRGEVESIAFYLRPFTKTQEKGEGVTYHLFEERFWGRDTKGAKAPFVRYSVYMTSSLVNQFTPGSGSYSWEQLPHFVREQLRREFSAYRIGEAQRLPFNSLGVYLLRFTPSLSRMPWLKFGESVLDGITNELCDYDLLHAARRTEIYTARARIIAKRGMTRGNNVNANAGMDSYLYTEYESTDTTDKGIHVLQPPLRSAEFRELRNSILEEIATGIGVSPSSFAQYLQDSSNRTAREVSAEESATALFVENKRDIMTEPINALLADVAAYKGYVDRVAIKWSLAGQSNYTLLTDNVTKLYTSHIMSLELAVKSIHPDLDEAQIQAEIKRIREEEAQRAQDPFGDDSFADLLSGGTAETSTEDGEDE